MSGRRFNRHGSQIGGKAGRTHALCRDESALETARRNDVLAAVRADVKSSKREKTSKLPKEPVGLVALDVFGHLLQLHPKATRDELRASTVALFYRYCTASVPMPGGMFDRHILRLDMPTAIAIADALEQVPSEDLDAMHLGRVNEVLCAGNNGSFYTPFQDFCVPMVKKTLEPILNTIRSDGPLTQEKILQLRVCDPAVGAGVFLLALIDHLAGLLVEAWYSGPLDAAKRLVAVHCCYGVDIDPVSVLAAKCAVTLWCKAGHMPIGWLDENIKHGDGLVGLRDPEQFKRFTWRNPEELSGAPNLLDGKLRATIDTAIRDAVQWRKRQLMELSLAAEK